MAMHGIKFLKLNKIKNEKSKYISVYRVLHH
jgi:hypothetical protein